MLACDILSESFGYALIRGQAILPVTQNADPILASLDGQHTLQEIQDTFGADALEMVGMLVHRGFATLQ